MMPIVFFTIMLILPIFTIFGDISNNGEITDFRQVIFILTFSTIVIIAVVIYQILVKRWPDCKWDWERYRGEGAGW